LDSQILSILGATKTLSKNVSRLCEAYEGKLKDKERKESALAFAAKE
jgi:hypothetical protein